MSKLPARLPDNAIDLPSGDHAASWYDGADPAASTPGHGAPTKSGKVAESDDVPAKMAPYASCELPFWMRSRSCVVTLGRATSRNTAAAIPGSSATVARTVSMARLVPACTGIVATPADDV